VLAIGLVAVSLLAVQSATTEPVPATRLVYVPAQKLSEQCPTKLEVEAGIASRIGSSPFHEPAERVVVLSLDGDTTATKAKVELFDPDLKPLGERDLESGGGCSDLVEAAELAISIALAPSLALGQKPAPPPPPIPPPIEPRPVELPIESKPTEPEPPKPNEPPFRLLIGGGLDATVDLGPEIVVGPSISLAIRKGDVELRVERHEGVFPGFDTKHNFFTGAGVATLGPCAHFPLLAIGGDGDAIGVSGCGTISAGTAWAVGAYIGPGFYVGAGGRLAAEWTQANLSSFRLWGQVEYSVQRMSFIALNGPSPFTQEAPVTVSFGVAYEVPFSF
jgi:hypothetical protein